MGDRRRKSCNLDNGVRESISKWTLPSSLERKGRGGEKRFGICKIFSYDVIIKVIVMFLIFCVDYLEELICLIKARKGIMTHTHPQTLDIELLAKDSLWTTPSPRE